MQTLGLSDSTPRTESRLKSLFWPTVQSAADVDYLGAQGYWICTVVAAVSFVYLIATGHPVMGVLSLLVYYLGGVGVRERSHYASGVVLVLYGLDAIASGLGIARVIFLAVLLSNFRATWISSRWEPESDEAVVPPRLASTWSDKFVDSVPAWLWPKVRVFFYILSLTTLVLYGIGIVALMTNRGR